MIARDVVGRKMKNKSKVSLLSFTHFREEIERGSTSGTTFLISKEGLGFSYSLLVI